MISKETRSRGSIEMEHNCINVTHTREYRAKSDHTEKYDLRNCMCKLNVESIVFVHNDPIRTVQVPHVTIITHLGAIFV